jgi:amino acid transporter
MEDYRLLINFVSNLILTLSFTAFIIFVFGRQESKINKMPWYKTFLVKLGLVMCTVASLLNALMFQDAPWTEVMLNAGLSMVFAWAAYFHYNEFVKIDTKKIKKVSKRSKK